LRQSVIGWRNRNPQSLSTSLSSEENNNDPGLTEVGDCRASAAISPRRRRPAVVPRPLTASWRVHLWHVYSTAHHQLAAEHAQRRSYDLLTSFQFNSRRRACSSGVMVWGVNVPMPIARLCVYWFFLSILFKNISNMWLQYSARLRILNPYLCLIIPCRYRRRWLRWDSSMSAPDGSDTLGDCTVLTVRVRQVAAAWAACPAWRACPAWAACPAASTRRTSSWARGARPTTPCRDLLLTVRSSFYQPTLWDTLSFLCTM
jgi:hypothetical protein